MSGLDSSLHLAFVRRNKPLLRFWADLESFLLGKKIQHPVRSPIFVCGLARSGTTLVTHILNTHRRTGSFLYRDVPFVEIPYFWHFVAPLYYGHQSLKLREHGDQLLVDPNSPDAFEELLWKNAIPDYENGKFCSILDEKHSDPQFEQELLATINKVLYVRGKKERYLSKGNYNLFRLHYIKRLFPDAKIILCVRDPFAHAHSLARVHAKFVAMSKQDPAFAKKLEILGHYEFGPQRKPIQLPSGRASLTAQHWEKGEDYPGYLLQWQDVYSFAGNSYGNDAHILWLDQSDLLEHPSEILRKLLQFCELPEEEIDTENALRLIKGTTSYPSESTPYDAELAAAYQSVRRNCE